jgi:hypothetical protein
MSFNCEVLQKKCKQKEKEIAQKLITIFLPLIVHEHKENTLFYYPHIFLPVLFTAVGSPPT